MSRTCAARGGPGGWRRVAPSPRGRGRRTCRRWRGRRRGAGRRRGSRSSQWQALSKTKSADLVGAGVVVVDRLAPGGVVPVGEVRAVGAEVVPVGPEVVVDHVENHADPGGVGGVDEALEPVGPAVGVVGGEQVDAVVPPAAIAGELDHRQQLEVGDAEVDEVGQLLDRRLERPLRRERADVGLVDQRSRQRRRPPPQVVGPLEGAVVDEPRRTVHAVGLELRARIGEARPAVERELVVGPRGGLRHLDRPPARPFGRRHRHPAPLGRQHEIHPLRRPGRPHRERRHRAPSIRRSCR